MARKKTFKIDASLLPIMPVCCKTCPFKLNEKGFFQNNELANEVTSTTLFKGHQLCHKDGYKKDKELFRCKGSFDENKQIYDRLNVGHLIK